MEQFFISFRIAKQGIRKVILLWFLFSSILYSHAQDYSTWGEIYDFEIGDVFHFRESCSGSGDGYLELSITNIVDKTLSADSSSVSYHQFIQTYTSSSSNPDWVYDEYYETIWYHNLKNYFIADTTYTSSNFNGRKISFKDLSSGIYWVEHKYAVDGCGIAIWYWRQIDLPAYDCELDLKYFKKGDEEWGTPLIFVGLEESMGDVNSFNCYPNPFTTSTTIEYELYSISNIQFTVYNMMGEVVYMEKEARRPQGNHKINWSPDNLPAGLYYAVLRSEDGVSVVKMIKQR